MDGAVALGSETRRIQAKSMRCTSLDVEEAVWGPSFTMLGVDSSICCVTVLATMSLSSL